MTNRLAVVALWLFAAPGGGAARGQGGPPPVGGMDELADRSAPLVEHLWHNCKVVGQAREYGAIEYGKLLGTRRFEIIAGSDADMYKYCYNTEGKAFVYQGGFVRTPDLLWNVQKGPDKQEFTLTKHVEPWESEGKNREYRSAILFSPIGYSIPWCVALSHSREEDYFPLGDECRGSVVAAGTYNGAAVITVRATLGAQIYKTDYLDPKTCLLIASETVGKLDLKARKVIPVRQVTEVTYGPPAENGLPFPRAVKGWVILPDGKRHPMTDIEYTEYRRYAPTADELDLEKQFGIKPLPVGPRPPLPDGVKGRPLTRWLFAGAGVLAAITGVLVYMSRRRRATV